MKNTKKIAIVTDYLNVFGGAERMLLGIMEAFPDATIFTSFYREETMLKYFSQFRVVESKYSYFFKRFGKFSTILYPIAFESFNFEDFDIVISLSSAFAKCIIVPENVVHIAYILTPPRFLYNMNTATQDKFKKLKIPFLVLNNFLRLKDFEGINRADFVLSISLEVQKRVKKFYRRESTVIYPFVDTNLFNADKTFKEEDYFLVVSRLEKYKNIEMAIRACIKANVKLKIIGDGSFKKSLLKISDSGYIDFVGNVDDLSLIKYIKQSIALIFPTNEDFGLTPIEALACGKSVIALNKGGVKETVINKKTGLFFDGERELIEILRNFNSKDFDAINCRENALQFSKDKFLENLREYVLDKTYKDHVV